MEFLLYQKVMTSSYEWLRFNPFYMPKDLQLLQKRNKLTCVQGNFIIRVAEDYRTKSLVVQTLSNQTLILRMWSKDKCFRKWEKLQDEFSLEYRHDGAAQGKRLTTVLQGSRTFRVF